MRVLTDGMYSYHRAIGSELWYRSGSEVVNPHQHVPSIRAKVSNNLVERLHGTEKERIKVMRGFDTRRGAKAIMEGFRVHYNMVRKHTVLGTTPAIEAGLPDVGGFRWKGILELAAKPRPRGDAVIEFIVSPRRRTAAGTTPTAAK
jgi:integrase-like protein